MFEEILAMLGEIEIGSLVEEVSKLFAQESFLDKVVGVMDKIGTVDFGAIGDALTKITSLFS